MQKYTPIPSVVKPKITPGVWTPIDRAPTAIGSVDPWDNLAPHNIEAEKALLGALLIDNRVADNVHELTPAHFFDPVHASIYEIATGLVRAGKKADPVTLREYFGGHQPIDGMPTVLYLAHLVTQSTGIAGAKSYAQTIRNLAVRRDLQLIGEDTVRASRESHIDFPPGEIIEEAESRLFALAREASGERDTSLTFADAVTSALAHVEEARQGHKSGIATGLTDLDARLGGLQPTDLIILAGRPGMGKSALAMGVAVTAAKSGVPIHFFSMEMSAEQLAMRALGEHAEIAASRLRKGRITEAEASRVRSAAQPITHLPITIDELGGATLAQLAARARRGRRRTGTGLVVIDYIQLMDAGLRRRENRVQDISEITRGLKALAKELNVPVLALSQLSRNVEHRDNKRPQLPDLRESGSIEQDADVVLFCFREEYYLERDKPDMSDASAAADWKAKMQKVAGKAEIIIGKFRHGETGTVNVQFSGEFTRFSDLARETQRHGI